MNNVTSLNRSQVNLQAIEAYRTVALSQGPNEPAGTGATNGTNGAYGIQDTVELSSDSLRRGKSRPNGTNNTDDTNAGFYRFQKTASFEKAASISDESETQGRNEFPPRVSKTGKEGPPVEDLQTSQRGGSVRMGIPGGTQNNETLNVNDVTNTRIADERLKNNVTGNPVTRAGNPLNSAVSNDTAKIQTAREVSAGVPPVAPTSLESSEGPDRKASQVKTEDVNKTGRLNSVQRNEANETENLSSGVNESEAARTRDFLKDRYREPGIAVYVESNNLTSTKNYTETTLLQNVGSQIAQASAPVNRISVYA